MKVSKKFLTLLALPMIAVATAQNVPVPTMAPGAKQIQTAPKTMEEALKFLPDTVMVVNGRKVTKAEVIKTLKDMVPEQYIGQLPQAQLKQMVIGMLDVEIMAEVAAMAGYPASEAALKADLKKEFEKLTPEQKKSLEARIKSSNKTIDQFIDELAKNKATQREQAIDKWIAEKINPTINVSDVEALKFYEANKVRFVSPESITASHILIQPEKPGDKASEQKAEAKAQAILAQIKKGADFGLLAQAESACPSGKRAKGSLGKMTKEGLDKDFWNAAFALKKGEYSGVVKTQFGYHIIRLEDKTVSTPLKYEDMQANIKAHLKNQALQQQLMGKIEAAKKSGFAKISKF